jgi:hypothetical protein
VLQHLVKTPLINPPLNGKDHISRTINIPSFALEMMNPQIRDRFRVRHIGVDALDGRPGRLIEFRERDRPTRVRTLEGRDQPSRLVALVGIQTGEVLSTVLTWERIEGLIAVYYGHAPGHCGASADPYGRALRRTQRRARRRRGDVRQLPAIRDERADRPVR